MLTFHSYVHSLARAVAGRASSILVLLAQCVETRDEPDLVALGSLKPEILVEVEALKTSSKELLAALPEEVDIGESGGQLDRHVGFIEYWIRRDRPQSCLHDPSDILVNDLPGVMSAFDRWYDATAAPHPELVNRLRRHIQSGDMKSAVRDGFAIWKTRIVELFGLPDDIDGSRLSNRLFDEQGATAEILTERQRSACDNLYTSLYTLLRNPPSHGDVNLDRQLSEGGLTLLAWLLTMLENAVGSSQLVRDAL